VIEQHLPRCASGLRVHANLVFADTTKAATCHVPERYNGGKAVILDKYRAAANITV
jgi:hypothetical protein